MGGEVCRLIAEQTDMELVGGIEAKGHPAVGTKLGTGTIGSDLGAMIADANTIVDFSAAEATVANCRLAALAGKLHLRRDRAERQPRPMRWKNALSRFRLSARPTSGRRERAVHAGEGGGVRLGPDYDVEVIETHHRMKKDAPSGTATRLVDILTAGAGRAKVVHGREGKVGEKPKYEIGVSSIRTGGVVGEHTVVFGCAGERLELTHKAESRAALATGVVAAIRFLKGRAPGFHSIEDVLAASPR